MSEEKTIIIIQEVIYRPSASQKGLIFLIGVVIGFLAGHFGLVLERGLLP